MKKEILFMLMVVFCVGACLVAYFLTRGKENETTSAASVEIEDLNMVEFGDYIVLSDGTALSKF